MPSGGIRLNGPELRTLRQQQGLILSQLSRMVGCSPSHLAKIERGERRASAWLVKEICHTLDVPWDYLVSDEQD